MLLLLSRDGTAGMCGVCGEIGLPGDDEPDKDAPPISPGIFDSCRLEDDDDRCSMTEEDMESDKCVLESRMRVNLEYCAAVRCELALTDAWSVLLKLVRPREFVSSIFKKSPMLCASS